MAHQPDDRVTEGPFLSTSFNPAIFAGSANFWVTARAPDAGVWGEPSAEPGDEGFYVPQ